MGLSNILDKKNQSSKKTKVEPIKCMKNIKDCQYILNNGKCAMEWCIYEELPKTISDAVPITERSIECMICGKEKHVSIYNPQLEYLCDDCKRRIKELIYNE